MRVALRTSQQWKLARSPRDHRYCHQHLLHVASIEAVFSAQWGLGSVAVRPEGPLSVRGGTVRSRTLAWIPGSYSSPPRPASRAALPEPAMSGRLPSCNAPPPGRAYQSGMHLHWLSVPWVPEIADFTDIPNMGVVLLSCFIRNAIIRARAICCCSPRVRFHLELREPKFAVASGSAACSSTTVEPHEYFCYTAIEKTGETRVEAKASLVA